MTSLRAVLVPAALLLLAAGCAKQQQVVPDSNAAAQASKPPPPAELKPAAPIKEDASDELATLIQKTVLHFNFDDATLTSQSQDQLRALADGLRRRPNASVRIAGHCDERGTVEYNLALGQRRATAARRYLLDLGIPETTVDTISFGAEKPVADGHDEDAWAKNRRAEAEPLKK